MQKFEPRMSIEEAEKTAETLGWIFVIFLIIGILAQIL